jgi:FMN phosphatase YigB (HAD superfamily)
MPPVRCVAFDLGGVIVQVNAYWEDAMAAAGLPVPAGTRRHLDEFEGLHLMQDESISFDEYLSRLAHYLGVSADEALLAHGGILGGEYEGLLDIVLGLQGLGIRTAALSDTNEAHVKELLSASRFPTVQALDRIVTSYEARANKPSPAIYAYFEQVTGFGPTEIVFFDDKVKNVEGAEEAGWRGFVVDSKGGPASQIRAALASAGIVV